MKSPLAAANELRYAIDKTAFAERVGLEIRPTQRLFLKDARQRLLLCCHRQWGKSTVTSVLAAHCIIYNQYRPLVLIGAPTEKQSMELLRKIRDTINALPFAPDMLIDNMTEMEWRNGARVVALPANERRIRGYSNPALVLIDEASQVPDLIYNTLRPMMIRGETTLVLLSTLKGKRGFFWRIWQDKSNDERWGKHTIPVTKSMKYVDKQELEEQRLEQGERWYNQEFMCEPMEIEGSLIPTELLEQVMDSHTAPLVDSPVLQLADFPPLKIPKKVERKITYDDLLSTRF